MTFTERMTRARNHESAVASKLRARGYVVGDFGQGQLSPDVRDALRSHPTKLRWLPDLIAISAGEVLLIDAKFGRTDTPNYDMEKASLDAMVALQLATGVPVVIVWADMRCSYVMALEHCDGRTQGPHCGNGSGTPYWLFPKAQVGHHMDDVFTDAAIQACAQMVLEVQS